MIVFYLKPSRLADHSKSKFLDKYSDAILDPNQFDVQSRFNHLNIGRINQIFKIYGIF